MKLTSVIFLFLTFLIRGKMMKLVVVVTFFTVLQGKKIIFMCCNIDPNFYSNFTAIRLASKRIFLIFYNFILLCR